MISILAFGGVVSTEAFGQVVSTRPAPVTAPTAAIDYRAAAHEVTQHVQKAFFLPKHRLYARSLTDREPEFMWGNGIIFSALAAAARHEPGTYAPLMSQFFSEMNRYWDTKSKIPGYEPSPTRGNGNDKYYDDNAWMVLTFAEAYEMTGDRRYLQRADATLTFVLSGWDDEQGGGIWWHEGHKGDSKNTCSNAPAAVACLRMATVYPPAKAKASVAKAREIVEWTTKTFQQEDGLFGDGMNLKTKHVNKDRLTYNTALMIRAWLGLHRATGEAAHLAEAKRVARASDWFLDKKTGAYRDSVKWSHLMVEADLEMYRATGDADLLKRATDNARHQYETWKTTPPDTVMDNASIARTLWLMADMESDVGRQFWNKSDAATRPR